MKDVVLTENLPYLRIDVAAGNQNLGPIPPETPDLGLWTQYGVLNPIFVNESKLDIAGLTKQNLTFFPMGGDVQRSAVSMGNTTAFAVEWVIVSVSPVDWGKVDVTPLNVWNHLPGQFGDNQEGFQQMIWGKSWTWTLNTNLQQNFAVAVNSSLIGSGEPTNGDRLYVYRIIMLTDATEDGFAEFGAARLVLSGQLREEAQYAQIMRMRRTYELQQSPDRD